MTQSRPTFARRGLLSAVFLGLIVLSCGWLLYDWTFNMIYVPEGHSLRLRYKGPPLPFLPGYGTPEAKTGFAQVDEQGRVLEKGVLSEMLGPGRHFRTPLYWERELVPDVVIKPGEIGLVTSKLGKQLPVGEYLVDGDLGKTEFKGVLRKVFGPGRYRINNYAYAVTIIQTKTIQDQKQVKYAGWVRIPAGYVGVVTNLAGNPATGAKTGIQEKVLPAGIYPINEKEQQVDIVKIGYQEMSIVSKVKTDRNGQPLHDAAGEPIIEQDDSSIFFHSNDGFPINMDFTAIWGIMPDQAPNVINKFGNVESIEQKVVIPQVESICRNVGAKFGVVELLVGDSRQMFQEAASAAFQKVLEEKDITLLNGLVRHIYIPQDVRTPIQESFIADELKLTREEQQVTVKIEADYREAVQKIELEMEKVRVETEKMVAIALAEGNKTAQETIAETRRLEAQIDREIAELESQAIVLLGRSKAEATTLMEQAKADKFQLAVAAFGSGEAYNQWAFAQQLPEKIQLNLIYAGDGTFWTDLKGFSETLLGSQTRKNESTGNK